MRRSRILKEERSDDRGRRSERDGRLRLRLGLRLRLEMDGAAVKDVWLGGRLVAGLGGDFENKAFGLWRRRRVRGWVQRHVGDRFGPEGFGGEYSAFARE